jgi:hypothetical protein
VIHVLGTHAGSPHAVLDGGLTLPGSQVRQVKSFARSPSMPVASHSDRPYGTAVARPLLVQAATFGH